MKRLKIISAALCILIPLASCSVNNKAPAGEGAAPDTSATNIEASTHQVTVEDLTRNVISSGEIDYISSCPKLIVDGAEATEINTAISEHITEAYPLIYDEGYVDGYETLYKWGVKNNTVSIVVYAASVSEDYYTVEVYNYDLDTLSPLEDTEVAKRLGMTDEELFDKTAEIFTERYGDVRDIDVVKSIEQIDYYNITPYITPEGNPGVAAYIYYAQDSQFCGMESMRCFDLTKDHSDSQ